MIMKQSITLKSAGPFLLLGQIQSPIMSLLGMIPQLIHASASVDRLVEIENTEQEESLVQADASISLQRASLSLQGQGAALLKNLHTIRVVFCRQNRAERFADAYDQAASEFAEARPQFAPLFE